MNSIRKRRMTWAKRGIQIAFFIFIFAIVFSHFAQNQGVHFPWTVLSNFHAICPFGAVETAGRLLIDGVFIPKIHESNFWVFSAVILVTLLIGPAFCGYLCPLGSVQEWVGNIGRILFKKRYNRFLSVRVDRVLGYARYAVLILILVRTTQMISLVFQRVDPYYALFHFWMGDVFFTALMVLVIVLLLSVFFERPWCRWFCPFGALLGIVQLISPWKIRRNTQMCTSCTLCSRACPMRISVHEKHSILDTRCNRCTACIESCRREGGLIYGPARLPFLRLKDALVSGILALSIFSAPILLAYSAGFFKTSTRRPVVQGELRVEEIKGSMTLKELARGFNIDVITMVGILSIPPGIPDSTKLFDLEDVDDSLTIKTLRDRLEHYVAENRG